MISHEQVLDAEEEIKSYLRQIPDPNNLLSICDELIEIINYFSSVWNTGASDIRAKKLVELQRDLEDQILNVQTSINELKFLSFSPTGKTKKVLSKWWEWD